jgi:DNA (cytosine-5)-methyltransferase 1
MGEQVAGKAGYGWFDGVRADLEATGYAGRAVDIPALAVNAPHIRQRLYWVALDMANAQNNGQGRRSHSDAERSEDEYCRDNDLRGEHLGSGSSVRDMADTDEGGRGRRPHDGDGECDGQEGERHEDHGQPAGGGEDCGDVADANVSGLRQRHGNNPPAGHGHTAAPEGRSGHWDNHVWLTGSDGKARRSQPGLPLLVDGASGGLALVRTRKDGAKETHTYSRVGALRAFGNAIVTPLAKEVIIALMEVLDGEQSLQENR